MKKMVKKTLSLFLILNMITTPLLAGEIFKNTEQYIVKEGDTLWDISNKFLHEPWRWSELWQANPSIENPNLIYPKDIINIVESDGNNYITVNRNSSLVEYTLDQDMQYVKKSPSVTSESLSDAIPLLKYDRIKKYMSDNFIVNSVDLENKGYVIKNPDGNLISGTNDDVFVYFNNLKSGQIFTIYNNVKEYKDGNKILGQEVNKVGEGIITAVSNDNIGLMKILSTKSGIKSNYNIIPKEKTETSNYLPSKPESNVVGRIISIGENVNSVGLYDSVLINKGTEANLEIGNLLEIKSKEEIINNPDPKRPDETIILPNKALGLLMIYKVYDNLSYGVIVKSTAPIKKDLLVKTPE